MYGLWYGMVVYGGVSFCGRCGCLEGLTVWRYYFSSFFLLRILCVHGFAIIEKSDRFETFRVSIPPGVNINSKRLSIVGNIA